MASKIDSATLAALAAAKGMKATKIEAGASCGMSARDFYKAARDQKVERVIEDYSDPRVQIVYDHLGREHARNAEGEWLY